MTLKKRRATRTILLVAAVLGLLSLISSAIQNKKSLVSLTYNDISAISTATGAAAPASSLPSGTANTITGNKKRTIILKQGDDDNEEEDATTSNTNTNTAGSNSTSFFYEPKLGDRFDPGALPHDRRNVLSQCYIPPIDAKNYRVAGSCSYSEKYGILLVLSPKTGSSTQRFVMKQLWNGTNDGCRKIENRGINMEQMKLVVATREPLSHFVSGYKEMLYRTEVWENEEYAYDKIPSHYSSFLNAIKGWEPARRKAIISANDMQSLQKKTEMFGTFVNEYDGINVFDIHLQLQAYRLRESAGRSDFRKFDWTLESSTLTGDMGVLAEQIGAPKPPLSVKKRDRGKESLDLSLSSNATIRKICKLRASDYCCLNYKLPEVCSMAGIPKGERVSCEWVHNQDGELAIGYVFE